MKKSRFFLSIIGVMILLLGLNILGGNDPLLYLDIASLLCIILFTLIPFLASYKMSGIRKGFKIALSTGGKSEADRAYGIKFVKTWDRLSLFSSAVTFMFGIIGMLAWLEDTASVGANLGVALIVMFYYFIMKLAIFVPLKASLEIQE